MQAGPVHGTPRVLLYAHDQGGPKAHPGARTQLRRGSRMAPIQLCSSHSQRADADADAIETGSPAPSSRGR